VANEAQTLSLVETSSLDGNLSDLQGIQQKLPEGGGDPLCILTALLQVSRIVKAAGGSRGIPDARSPNPCIQVSMKVGSEKNTSVNF